MRMAGMFKVKAKKQTATNKKGTVVKCYGAPKPIGKGRIMVGKVKLVEFMKDEESPKGFEYWKAIYTHLYINGQFRLMKDLNNFKKQKIKGTDNKGKPYSFVVQQEHSPASYQVMVKVIE